MNKKLLLLSLTILSTGVLQAKETLGIFPVNSSFDTAQAIPLYKKDIKGDAQTFTAKILKESEQNIEDYTVFDKPIRVKKELYAYSTQKLSNDNITREDENSLLFLQNVKFDKGASINLRTNFDEKLSDFMNFHDITLEGGDLLVKVIDSSKTPRFVKTPLFVLPATAENANIKLANPVEVQGIEYGLKREKIDDYMLFYLEPLYPTEELAEKFAQYELSLPKITRDNKIDKTKNKYLREKITIGKEGKYIFSSDILDVYTR